ncbi:HNH endonuclease, partial [Glutamicibacter sp. AOP3-A1-12]
MSEAMVRRHRPPTPALHQDLESLMGRLQSKLAWIEEHGSEAECAQAIEELEELISSYRYHQAA